MATYYKWRKSTVKFSDNVGLKTDNIGTVRTYYFTSAKPNIVSGLYNFSSANKGELAGDSNVNYRPGPVYIATATYVKTMYYCSASELEIQGDGDVRPDVAPYTTTSGPGTSKGYVYSTSSSAYPTNGTSGSYYYDQRTTVTSPTSPNNLNYSQEITTQLVNLSWEASTSNTDYPVHSYELSYSVNNGVNWNIVGTTTQTSYDFGLPTPYINQIKFRVRAMDSNSQFSDYITGENSTVNVADVELPVLTLPQNVKLGTTIAISWNSVQDATNYIVQRKTMDNEEWTQIYSGSNLSCSNLIDALGISYRICFKVGSNYTSPWSEEYKLSTYEKIIEMTYLDSDGQYMPLYPRTITNAVVNSSDLIQTTMLTGKYTGNGMESNEVLLANNIEPKVGFLYDSNGNITGSVGFNDEGNLVVDKNLGFNESGSEYGYVVIGEKSNNDFE